MGSTASTVLFEGLCAVLERNCGYVCKSEVDPRGLEEPEWVPSRRESQAKPDAVSPNSSEIIKKQADQVTFGGYCEVSVIVGWQSSGSPTYTSVVELCLLIITPPLFLDPSSAWLHPFPSSRKFDFFKG
ncbi:dedicator of cytokinesis protein 9 isoform X1 [Arapaima gigas]